MNGLASGSSASPFSSRLEHKNQLQFSSAWKILAEMAIFSSLAYLHPWTLTRFLKLHVYLLYKSRLVPVDVWDLAFDGSTSRCSYVQV